MLPAPQPWTWFDLAWPWMGLVAAGILVVLLFATNRLRHNLSLSRWRDITWLSWLAVAAYMVHQFEEYGIDLHGVRHAFPNALCGTLGLDAYPACPIPPFFYLAVNISLVWFVAPLGALLSHRYPLAKLSLYSVLIANGLAHVLPWVLGRGYGPGALTAALVFLPLFLWVCYACFGKWGLPNKGISVLVALGLLLHVILIGSLVLFIHGKLGAVLLNLIQVANACLLLTLAWLADRHSHALLPGLNSRKIGGE